MRRLDLQVTARISALQSLDDAITFRSGRLGLPCLDCTGRRRCTEHALDAYLLEVYKARYAAASADALADMSHLDIGKLTHVGSPPPTAAVLRAAVTARLREAAAAVPVMVRLDRDPVVVELDGQALAGHSRLPAGSSGQAEASGKALR